MTTTQRILTDTALLLLAVAGPVASSSAQGTQYCPGDGTWAACPCGNTNDGSMSGCDWHGTVGLPGGALAATGSNVVANADTFLVATNIAANFGIFFAGPTQPTNTLGDGLRCSGGGVVRLIPPTNPGSSMATHAVPLQLLDPGVGVGVTRNYQYWFRTPGGPCGTSSNTTNGYSIPWGAGGAYAEMVPIPAGRFEMGWHAGSGGFPNELPLHTVDLSAFYMDVYEVNNRKYVDYLNTAYAQGRVAVAGGWVYQVGGVGQALCITTAGANWTHITWNGATFAVTVGKEEHPVVRVTWYGACTYANQRSRDDGLTPCYDETTWACNFAADGYRLPTEAEWEYAARGGEHNPYYLYPWGDTMDGSKANYSFSGDPYEAGPYPETTPVGYYDGNQVPAGVDMANGYGLYDMSGNVLEWCWDRYDEYYYSYSPPNDPTGPNSGGDRVRRGGGWFFGQMSLPSARRSFAFPTSLTIDTGFRVLAVRP